MIWGELVAVIDTSMSIASAKKEAEKIDRKHQSPYNKANKVDSLSWNHQ